MSEFNEYKKFLPKAVLDREINSLVGLLKGLSIDKKINEMEKSFLTEWLNENSELKNKHPFSEILSGIELLLNFDTISEGQLKDLVWLCDNIVSNKYFDIITTGIQELHGILGGLVSDGKITSEELIGLQEWQNSRDYLRGTWPFEDISSIIAEVLQDGLISDEEHDELISFFGQFIKILDDKTINPKNISTPISKKGICAIDPIIEFSDKIFCATGAMSKYKRRAFQDEVERLGGIFTDKINKNVNYLVVGSEGNDCWAYACYGRKIESTVKLRQSGHTIWIVHEIDFHDAVIDAS